MLLTRRYSISRRATARVERALPKRETAERTEYVADLDAMRVEQDLARRVLL
jgi:hypothetical protein